MLYHGIPSATPVLRTGTMFGCCSEAASFTSRANRSTEMSPTISPCRTFMTTLRPSEGSCARHTLAIPPPPSSRSTVYVSPSVDWSLSRRSILAVERRPRFQLFLPAGIESSDHFHRNAAEVGVAGDFHSGRVDGHWRDFADSLSFEISHKPLTLAQNTNVRRDSDLDVCEDASDVDL